MSQNQAQTPPDAPDVRQLARQTLPESPFPGGREQAFRIWIRPEAHEAVWKHAGETPGLEICGVLVGKWAKDADGPYLSATEIIRGEAASSKFAEVTFTHETWSRINHEMDTKFAGLSIVGWYHSHPDFGIFLSDRDRFIQENFFSGAGQIAFVVDPVRKTEGAFIWQKGKPVLAPHCWVGDAVRASTAAGSEKPVTAPVPPPAGLVAVLPGGAEDMPPWMRTATRASFYVALFLLGFLLSNWLNSRMTDFERLRIKQDAIARTLIYYNLRPGLDKDLDQLAEDLSAAFKQAKALAAGHIKLAEEDKEVKENWEAMLASLDGSFRTVRTARAVYTLTPQEVEELLRHVGGKEVPAPKAGKKKDDDKTPPAKDEKPKPK